MLRTMGLVTGGPFYGAFGVENDCCTVETYGDEEVVRVPCKDVNCALTGDIIWQVRDTILSKISAAGRASVRMGASIADVVIGDDHDFGAACMNTQGMCYTPDNAQLADIWVGAEQAALDKIKSGPDPICETCCRPY